MSDLIFEMKYITENNEIKNVFFEELPPMLKIEKILEQNNCTLFGIQTVKVDMYRTAEPRIMPMGDTAILGKIVNVINEIRENEDAQHSVRIRELLNDIEGYVDEIWESFE